MNEEHFKQLVEFARQLDLDVVCIKDEEGTIVMVSIGEKIWLDELFSDF